MNKKGKYVLEGGANSGKTTIIKRLRERGYFVLNEVAREVLKERKHLPIDEQEQLARQHIIFNRQYVRENKHKGDQLFLDRGLVGVLAYSNHLLGYIPEGIPFCDLTNRYDKIFILDRLPFENDGLRIESGDAEAEKIHGDLVQAYRDVGYNPIKVPVMDTIEERVDFVLENIK